MRARKQGLAGTVLLVASLLACADEPETRPPSTDHDGSVAADAASDAATVVDDFVGCPDGVLGVGPGLSVVGKRLAVSVVAAVPMELERYINGWTVELRTLDGAPSAQSQVVRAQTFMPLHGHDGGVVPRITPLAEPGRVQIDRLNFIMRGPWEVRLWLRASTGEEDLVTFNVCVAK